jgi:hypothetical protein
MNLMKNRKGKKRFTKKDVKRAYDKGYKDAREIVIAANRLVANNDMDLETYLRQGKDLNDAGKVTRIRWVVE